MRGRVDSLLLLIASLRLALAKARYRLRSLNRDTEKYLNSLIFSDFISTHFQPWNSSLALLIFTRAALIDIKCDVAEYFY